MSEQTPGTWRRVLLLLWAFLWLLLASCSTNATNTTVHATYNYGNFATLANESVSPGDHISLTWKPIRGPDSAEASPTNLTIRADLVGPYSSPLALKEALQHSSCSTIPGRVVASIAPIQTDDWTNTTYTSTLAIPSGLASGYYDLFQKVSLSGTGTGSGGCAWTQSVIEIKGQQYPLGPSQS